MRILLASDHYPPFIGGAHRQTRLLATGLVGRGHEVTVVTPWSGGLPRVETDRGVAVHRVRQLRTMVPGLVRDHRQRHQPPFPDPVTIWELRRLINSVQPDLINVHGWLAFSVVIALGRKRIPLLVTARDYGYFCATRTLLQKGAPCDGPAPLKCLACAGDYYGPAKGWCAAVGVAASRPLLRRKVTGLQGVSSYVTEVHSQHFLRANPDNAWQPHEITLPDIQPGLNGSPASGNPEAATYLSQLPDEPFILFVGAFRRIKGLETLFGAYERLSDPPPLVLMGTFEWDSPEDFPKQAIVLTDVPHAAVMAAWDRALFGVMPSLFPEPLGGTVAEAMSRGKPVISTRIGGTTDIIDDETGMLVPQADVVGLAAAMQELISDAPRREALGRASAERSLMWKPSAVLPRFEQAYREIIAADSGTSAG